MKKRFLNLFLALALVVCVLPMVASAATGCKHDYSVNEGYRAGDEPTCTKTGISVLKCSNCEARTAQTAPVDKTKHTYVSGLCTECGDCENKHVSNKIVTAAKAATCAEDGVRYNVHQCKICDVFFCNNVVKETNDFPENVIPATGSHVLRTKLETVTPATCTEKEVARYKCRNCNYTEDVAIGKPQGHQWQGLSEVPATCTTEGKTAGTWCWKCGTIQTGLKTIPATGVHKYNQFQKNIKPATCKEKKINLYKCATCDDTKELPAGDLLACNIVETPAEAATCVAQGKTAGIKCTSCKVDGKYTCAYCKENMVPQKYTDALGHKYEFYFWAEAGKVATCTKDAIAVEKCSVCNGTRNKTVYAFGHDKDITVLKEATCTTDGLQCFVCKREDCSQYEFEVITAPGHTEEVVAAVDATCTSTGLTEGKKCSVCDETLLAQVVTDKLAHDFSVSVDRVEATCTADGYTAHMKCANCDATEGKEELDTDGHVYENYICKVCGGRDGSCEHKNRVLKYTAPTCSDKGSQSMWCPDCNYETMEMLDKVAHTPVDKSIAATCTTKGLKHIVCSVCNVDLEKEETPVIAHSNVQGVCSVCGTTVCDHSSTSITSTTSSCSVAGIKTETCNSCGKVTKTELPLDAHNHVNGVCSACGHKDSNRITSDYQDVYVVGGTAY